MFKGLKFVAIALVTLIVAEPAFAQFKPNFRAPAFILRRVMPPIIHPPSPLLFLPIKPSQAAAIAQEQFPNSMVVKVKLLPGGIYAVTLRTDTSLERVMVNGQNGDIM